MADQLDTIDQNIIKILQSDARTSYTKIARELDLNESTIRHRVTRLENTGVIMKYSITIDPKKMGYNAIAVVGIDVEPTQFLKISMQLTKIPEIRKVITTTGDHMLLCEIWTKDAAELTNFISEQIGSLEGVTKICPAIIHEHLKM